MAPAQHRGMLNLLFQWCTTIGIIIAQLINYGTVEIYEYGWRISLAIAAVPALMILFGGLLLPESPSSLISRNYHDEGRKVRFAFVTAILSELNYNTSCVLQESNACK